jgi:crotonobetaine/carnitine-CoA ligase
VTISSHAAGQQDTLVDALGRAVAASGDDVFFDIAGEPVTFGEFDRRTTRFAHALSSLGVSKGDTIVTISETHADTLMYWFSAAKLGAIWVPINLAYRHEFLRHQIADTGTRLVICDADYMDRLSEIAAHIPNVKHILCRGSVPASRYGDISIDSLEHHRGDIEAPVEVDIKPYDLANLTYTSGTTGPSKGCMISHNYMCTQGRQHCRAMALERGVVQWTPLPLFHSAAMAAVLGALISGTRISISPRFSVTTFWQDVARSGASRAFLMSSIFPLVAHAPDTPEMKACYGQLKMILGVPIAQEIRRIWETRFGVEFACSWCYGQTEVNRLAMVPYGEKPPENCAGRVSDEFELAILDKEERPVPAGKVGEICCRPRYPNVMFDGYWNRPEETARAWRNLWMHTGDMGWVDTAGYLYFSDRAKDYLRVRGENVSSFEVEKVFLSHAGILEIAIHGVQTDAKEDQIKATIVLHGDANITEHDLCRWSIDRLPYFAVPRYFEFRTELIKNPTGRVLKYKLREEGVTRATWDREAAGIQIRRRK